MQSRTSLIQNQLMEFPKGLGEKGRKKTPEKKQKLHMKKKTLLGKENASGRSLRGRLVLKFTTEKKELGRAKTTTCGGKKNNVRGGDSRKRRMESTCNRERRVPVHPGPCYLANGPTRRGVHVTGPMMKREEVKREIPTRMVLGPLSRRRN